MTRRVSKGRSRSAAPQNMRTDLFTRKDEISPKKRRRQSASVAGYVTASIASRGLNLRSGANCWLTTSAGLRRRSVSRIVEHQAD